MKLNICLIHEDSYSPSMPARPAITEIYGTYLPSFGHNITWITRSNLNSKEIKKINYKKVRIYSFPFNNAFSLPGKIFNFFSNYIKLYKFLDKLTKEKKFDIIQVRNNAYYSLIALIVKKKYGIPFVFQYSFPTGFIRTENEKKWYLKLESKIEMFITQIILKKADFVFPISKWMKKELSELGIPNNRMIPLPLGVNPEDFLQTNNKTTIRKKYNLGKEKILLYIGSMDKTRNLDVIIKAFSKTKLKHKNSKLLMVGEGTGKTDLEKLVSDLGLEKDVIFTGQISYFDIPNYIALSDICLCPVPPKPAFMVSSPTKLFEYMLMKKPIITNDEIPEQKNVINESKAGILVKYNSDSFAEAIIKLLKTPSEAKILGEKGNKWVIKNRSYKNMAQMVEKKYIDLIKTI